MPARKGSARRGGPLKGSTDPTTTTNVVAGTADVNAAVAAQAGLRLMGYAIKESASTPAAAAVTLLHGATVGAGAGLGAEHDLASNGEVFRWFGGDGISIPNGISVDRASGTTTIAIWTKVI